MGYRREPDGVDAAVGCAFMLIWALIAGLFAYLFESSKTKPEEKLRALAQGSYWAVTIEDVPCSNCQTVNEVGTEHCYTCGAVLAESNSSGAVQKTTKQPMSEGQKLAIVVLVVIFLICAVLASGVL